MIQPPEMKLNLPMQVADGAVSTTTAVWDILSASMRGDVEQVKNLVSTCPGLIYAQYNYTPPIHFAVREGHLPLVQYLLEMGAHDPSYKTYPFGESLVTIAQERGLEEIAALLEAYSNQPGLWKYKGDNGAIFYQRTEQELAFQKAVDDNDLAATAGILKVHPEFALDETYFWGEGILLFAVKENKRTMIDLLLQYGAQVPAILKWTQFYYFERLDGATYIMEKGMNPNVMSWHGVRILHDMAQKGDIPKVALLLKYGADMNSVEEEYCSTPLGMAARWGNEDMVAYLLEQGADPHKAGAPWATPLSWARQKGHTSITRMLERAN